MVKSNGLLERTLLLQAWQQVCLPELRKDVFPDYQFVGVLKPPLLRL